MAYSTVLVKWDASLCPEREGETLKTVQYVNTDTVELLEVH